MRPAERVIFALDVPGLPEAKAWVRRLAGRVGLFKVGLELYGAVGPAAVQMVREAGGAVFLDLKFHDIPATVAGAAREATRQGVAMFDVHAAGGTAMMRAAVEASREAAARQGLERPRVLAVTVLTSLGPAELVETGLPGPIASQVLRLAELALGAGLDGVVASAQEVARLRQALGDEFLIVTPGIRVEPVAGDDQQRAATPAEAVARGSNYLVIGRPLRDAPDPLAALDQLVRTLPA
ncbi:MAG: orotidine-5'-phosphate decarboxylase [Deltaproteobacteria bacterium]|nr:orotidine-5'-phosphate decarboxylase [Deltaproteobacteria bacterium]